MSKTCNKYTVELLLNEYNADLKYEIKENKRLEYNCTTKEEKIHTDLSVSINMTRGKGVEPLVVDSTVKVKQFINMEIDKYILLENYNAIFNIEKKCIECEIILSYSDAPDNLIFIGAFLRDLNIFLGKDISDIGFIDSLRDEEIKHHEVLNKGVKIYEANKKSIYLKYPSKRMIFINNHIPRQLRTYSAIENYVLYFEGFEIGSHENALKIIEEYGMSLSFRFSMGPIGFRLSSFQTYTANVEQVPYDANLDSLQCCDKDSVKLFIDGKYKKMEPGYKYLLFYQAIEFYYPKYKKLVGNEKIREKELIKYIAKENFDINEINHLFRKKEYIEYFKNKSKICDKVLNFNDQDNLMTNIAGRIYSIRNKIVHKKDIGELIIPQNVKLDDMKIDLLLIEHMASKIILINSKEFDVITN